jgi:predicted RNase H-like nuclease (RuvC/YqgF family)
MVTPADLIRELTLTNKHLIKKNENLKLDNHNLKVTNDMLKNKAATDQAVMNAAITIKKLETYNQALEDENQHLRAQLEFCAERKKIDDELEVLRKEVKSIDEELERRSKETEILEELEEQMRRLKQMSILETVQEDVLETAQEDVLGDSQKNVEPNSKGYPLGTKEDKK